MTRDVKVDPTHSVALTMHRWQLPLFYKASHPGILHAEQEMLLTSW